MTSWVRWRRRRGSRRAAVSPGARGNWRRTGDVSAYRLQTRRHGLTVLRAQGLSGARSSTARVATHLRDSGCFDARSPHVRRTQRHLRQARDLPPPGGHRPRLHRQGSRARRTACGCSTASDTEATCFRDRWDPLHDQRKARRARDGSAADRPGGRGPARTPLRSCCTTLPPGSSPWTMSTSLGEIDRSGRRETGLAQHRGLLLPGDVVEVDGRRSRRRAAAPST